jgi:hypothetical protein
MNSSMAQQLLSELRKDVSRRDNRIFEETEIALEKLANGDHLNDAELVAVSGADELLREVFKPAGNAYIPEEDTEEGAGKSARAFQSLEEGVSHFRRACVHRGTVLKPTDSARTVCADRLQPEANSSIYQVDSEPNDPSISEIQELLKMAYAERRRLGIADTPVED